MLPKQTPFRRTLVIIAVAMALGSAPAHALKGSEFLKYSDAQKHVYLAGVFDALGNVAVLNKSSNAKCIWGWLAEKPKERKALLDKSFRAYPDHATTAVIFANVQATCGPILPVTTQN